MSILNTNLANVISYSVTELALESALATTSIS